MNLRVAYVLTGTAMHAAPAVEAGYATTLCGSLAILGAGEFGSALTTGRKCETCTACLQC